MLERVISKLRVECHLPVTQRLINRAQQRRKKSFRQRLISSM